MEKCLLPSSQGLSTKSRHVFSSQSLALDGLPRNTFPRLKGVCQSFSFSSLHDLLIGLPTSLDFPGQEDGGQPSCGKVLHGATPAVQEVSTCRRLSLVPLMDRTSLTPLLLRPFAWQAESGNLRSVTAVWLQAGSPVGSVVFTKER